jgi:hypothetical protein
LSVLRGSTERQADRQASRQADGQQTDRQTDRQSGRQTMRLICRKKEQPETAEVEQSEIKGVE